ncbi:MULTISPECIES: hypothetical protein [unclassified Thioalkalivibrio]|uniref:hypothetical protein n=1 Tax=unclassified Thioalkalivibrio TaxID=2621013 RepID=UPI001E5BC4C6|nr:MULTISPECIES: hypothetical protein [unclassified Thioalkalivibrio]
MRPRNLFQVFTVTSHHDTRLKRIDGESEAAKPSAKVPVEIEESKMQTRWGAHPCNRTVEFPGITII